MLVIFSCFFFVTCKIIYNCSFHCIPTKIFRFKAESFFFFFFLRLIKVFLKKFVKSYRDIILSQAFKYTQQQYISLLAVLYREKNFFFFFFHLYISWEYYFDLMSITVFYYDVQQIEVLEGICLNFLFVFFSVYFVTLK